MAPGGKVWEAPSQKQKPVAKPVAQEWNSRVSQQKYFDVSIDPKEARIQARLKE